MNPSALIELPRLRIQNANAVSGPLSWGFPSPTAFTSFVHALQRKLDGVTLGGVGIVCHHFEPQIYRPVGGFNQIFRLARHPYIAGWKKFANKAAAIVEEGRAHFEVTLLIEVFDELDEDDQLELTDDVRTYLPGMRIAGGSLQGHHYEVNIEPWPEFAQEQRQYFHHQRYRWLPGFTLVERRDLLQSHLAELQRESPQANALDALLDILALHHEPVTDEETGRAEWQIKPRPGWLVPLPVGYGALTKLHAPGVVANSRDPEMPFRFVESLYTLGQWLSPHRLDNLKAMIWHMETEVDDSLYVCRNQYHLTKTE